MIYVGNVTNKTQDFSYRFANSSDTITIAVNGKTQFYIRGDEINILSPRKAFDEPRKKGDVFITRANKPIPTPAFEV